MILQEFESTFDIELFYKSECFLLWLLWYDMIKNFFDKTWTLFILWYCQ